MQIKEFAELLDKIDRMLKQSAMFSLCLHQLGPAVSGRPRSILREHAPA